MVSLGANAVPKVTKRTPQSSENFRKIFLSKWKRLTYMNRGTCSFYFLFFFSWFQFSSSNSLVLIFFIFKFQFSHSNSILPNSLGTQFIYIFNSKLLAIRRVTKSSQGHNVLLSKDKGQSYLPCLLSIGRDEECWALQYFH